MGRKRAAFAESIAEEEQRYAQVLWEIRDLRGETQQALGRLIGWSVSLSAALAAATGEDQAERELLAPAGRPGRAGRTGRRLR
jgi:hypothetical protein